jgi:uncharacterized protein (TIRG00374 family)
MKFKRRRGIFKVCVSLCIIIILLLFLSDPSTVWQNVQKVSVQKITILITVIILSQAISSLRWQWILEREGTKIGFKTLFTSYMSAMFVNNILPTSVGGDFVKIIDIYRITKNVSLSMVSVFFDRLIGLVTLFFISWIGIAFAFQIVSSPTIWGWIFINFVCIIITLIFLNETIIVSIIQYLEKRQSLSNIGKVLRLSYERLILYKKKKKFLVKLLIISLPIQFNAIIIYHQVAISMNIIIPFIFYLFAIPFILIFSLLPISFGGLGVREAAAVFVFANAGVSEDAALSMALVAMSITYFASLVGGILLLFRTNKVIPDQKAKKELFEL